MSPADRERGAAAAAPPVAPLKVVDFSWLSPGLYCTSLLAQAGAQVTSVEAPTRAGLTEGMGGLPLWKANRARDLGLHPLYRDRESIVIDLKQPAGRDLALTLAENADVLVETFRPGVADRLGIGYDAVAERNPAIVYCSLTGYGQGGPDRMKPGHDLNYLASSGALAGSTRPGQAPGIPLNLLGDFAGGGLMAAYAILTAVVRGTGAHLDVNMVGSIQSMLETPWSWVQAGGPDPSWGQGLLSGVCPFYDAYETADGRWLTVAALEHKFFEGLCDVLVLTDFADAYTDVARWPQLRARMIARLRERTLAQWLEIFEASDGESCVAPVLSLEEVFEGPGADAPPPPFRSSDERSAGTGRFSRTPGEHGAAILAAAGIAPSEAERLYASGAVGRPAQPVEAVG